LVVTVLKQARKEIRELPHGYSATSLRARLSDALKATEEGPLRAVLEAFIEDGIEASQPLVPTDDRE